MTEKNFLVLNQNYEVGLLNVILKSKWDFKLTPLIFCIPKWDDGL